jgi:hypothetical protein
VRSSTCLSQIREYEQIMKVSLKSSLGQAHFEATGCNYFGCTLNSDSAVFIFLIGLKVGNYVKKF